MKHPRLISVLSTVVLGFFSLASHAALVSKLGGAVVYDTDRDITWLADANLSASNTFGTAGIDSAGKMDWSTASTWIANMNASNGGAGYLGFNDWRLPATLVPDNSCSSSNSNGSSCTGSEMGHLFYTEFGATANTSALITGNPTELARFTNIQTTSGYWSSTPFNSNPPGAYTFVFGTGSQLPISQANNNTFVWAVRSGDVSAVPVPAAVWLFGSGLLGLVGMARRKKA